MFLMLHFHHQGDSAQTWEVGCAFLFFSSSFFFAASITVEGKMTRHVESINHNCVVIMMIMGTRDSNDGT